MPLNNKHRLLLVDDEESILNSLRRLFRNTDYEISTAIGAHDALAILHGTDKPFSLIISDQRMPEITGVEFLEESRKIFPQAIRILLTGYADLGAVIDAINRGGIHRYINKPWNDDDLLLQVRQCLEQYDLVEENKRLLALTTRQNLELAELNKNLENKVEEKAREIIKQNEALTLLNLDLEANLYNTVKAFSSFAEKQNPVLAGHERRVGFLAGEIAKTMQCPSDEVMHVEIAGLLHDVGKIGLPHRMMEYKENEWSQAEKEAYRMHPRSGQDIVQFIKKLDHVGIMVRTHHECYDGSGFPNQLKEEEIPLGARIIAVADTYDKIVNLRINLDKEINRLMEGITERADTEELQKVAVLYLRQQSLLKYDPDVVKALLTIIREKKLLPESYRIVTLDELQAGMLLVRSLYTSSGRFLLPAQTLLTNGYIQKLKMLNENDPVDGEIFVRK